MSKKIPLRISIMIFLAITLMIPLGSSALSPDARKEKCEGSGGDWNVDTRDCICPKGTTSLWNYCWVITPKEVCDRIGGSIEQKKRDGKLIDGPAGSSFKCVKNSKDITSLALSKARKYNINISDPESLKKQIKEDIGGRTDEEYFPYITLFAASGLLFVFLVFYFRGRKENKH